MTRALAIAVPLMLLAAAPAEAVAGPGVRFHVLTVEETGSARKVLSEATVEGPMGTDFEIELRGGRFKMTARFLTDALAGTGLAVKATLNTRRLYGYSERDLPLYEEDVQNHDLTLDFDEQIILLPFGSPSSDERLQVEITPTALPDRGAAGQKLEIDILRRSEGGAVQIRAFRIPHRFVLDAGVLRDGVEIAHDSGSCVIEEQATLDPHSEDPAVRLPPISVGVREILRERPTDLVVFDYRYGDHRGSGVAPLGESVELAVPVPGDPQGRNHVLRLTIHADD